MTQSCFWTDLVGVTQVCDTLPPAANAVGMVYAASNHLGSGHDKLIYTGDGLNWTLQSFTTTDDGSSNNTDALMGSPDGAILVLIQSVISGHVLVSTDQGASWTARTISFTYSDYPDVIAFGDHGFLIGGQNGSILASTDGVTWTEKHVGHSGYFNSIHGMSFGAGVYVVTTDTGIWTSADGGTTWGIAIGNIPGFTVTSWKAINFVSDRFVAVAKDSVLIDIVTVISLNGVTWTIGSAVTGIYGLETNPSGGIVQSQIAYSGGKYMMIGTSLAGSVLLTSSDGLAWTTVATSGVNLDFVRSLLSVGAYFVALGYDFNTFTQYIATSTDGAAWTTNTVGGMVEIGIAACRVDVSPPAFAASPNQFTPASGLPGTHITLSGVRFNFTSPVVTFGTTVATIVGTPTPTSIVAAVPSMAPANVALSVTTTAGTAVSVDLFTVDPFPANPTGTVYVMSASLGTGTDRLLHSTNGTTWATISFSTTDDAAANTADSLAANGTTLVLNQLNILTHVQTSTDSGGTWAAKTTTHSDGTEYGYPIIYGGGKFMLGGINGGIMTSTDGLIWTEVLAAGAGPFTFVIQLAYAYSKFIAVTNTGVYYSTTGATWTAGWTSVSGFTTPYWDSVAFVGDKLIAFASDSSSSAALAKSAVSTNGTSWTQGTPVTGLHEAITTASGPGSLITYTNGIYLVFGQAPTTTSPVFATSSDGLAWTVVSPTGIDMSKVMSVTAIEGYFVAVGTVGIVASGGHVIAISTDGVAWTGATTTLDGGAISLGPAICVA